MTVLTMMAAVAVAPPAPARAIELGVPQVLADGLVLPWEVLPLGDGRLLISEKAGRIRVWIPGTGLQTAPVYQEAGTEFLGLARHPNFAVNRFVYAYVNVQTGLPSPQSPNGTFENRVIRLHDNGSQLEFSATVIGGIPGERNHDGGRLRFGPDGLLYVLTGDTHQPALPRDPASLAGKVLRVQAPGDLHDGEPAPGAPFPASPLVWTIGHRNPQGLDFDAAGRLFISEHGPSGEAYAGGRCCRDEINLIEGGADYGWPTFSGDDSAPGVHAPVVQSGASIAWAPSGASFAPDGRLYVATLLGQHLREFTFSGTTVVDQRELLKGTYGRLRTVIVDGDSLLITTSNTASADNPVDKLIRVPFTLPGAGAPAAAVARSAFTSRFAAKLQVTRSRVLRRERRLELLAPISSRASGSVHVQFRSAGRTRRFRQRIDSRLGRIRVERSIPPALARLGTGMVTLEYTGNERTRGQVVRLRAASRRAALDPNRPRLIGNGLSARGRIAKRVRGSVRVQLDWSVRGRNHTYEVQAPIREGTWQLDERLPPAVSAAVGARDGTLHSYILFTGYLPRRVRGEMRSFEVLGAR